MEASEEKKETGSEEEVKKETGDEGKCDLRDLLRDALDKAYVEMLFESTCDARTAVMQTYGVLRASGMMAKKLIEVTESLRQAKTALKEKEAFYLLNVDPETQQPYINGKNEAIRDAQKLMLTKAEREAVGKAESELARAERSMNEAANDYEMRLAILYIHAGQGFPEFRDENPETPEKESEGKEAAQAPQE